MKFKEASCRVPIICDGRYEISFETDSGFDIRVNAANEAERGEIVGMLNVSRGREFATIEEFCIFRDQAIEDAQRIIRLREQNND